ncbi:hypothetical protein QLQ12_15225 [Actinoplanes sp. NEAU-A12]|uniref:ESX-1 secretion-associated protein n=1 Tax=Actinoplanes sandaracinus TaxID=3045177 RepID=A0ABT6WJP5_9ACTN|nr:hypothetical protein [Actinoplanes sandaracinus]MDI6099951.1 hypothetical protein [Actinoplanes sandaracinus]
MSDRLDVDPAMLDAIADQLTRAGANVDATGKSAPPPPDAGLATGLITGVLARLCGNAAQLAGDLRTAGSRVTEANQMYAREDAASGQSIRGAS